MHPTKPGFPAPAHASQVHVTIQSHTHEEQPYHPETEFSISSMLPSALTVLMKRM